MVPPDSVACLHSSVFLSFCVLQLSHGLKGLFNRLYHHLLISRESSSLPQLPPLNPVYVRRVDPSVLVFSLSLHRQKYVIGHISFSLPPLS
jgi:hypothetical protein